MLASMRPQAFRQLLPDPSAGCVTPGCSGPASRARSEDRTLARYLAFALHDLCGKPIPAPLKCHSVGRGTSVPTGNTDACRWTEDASRTEPATVGAWRQTTTRKGSTEATKHQRNF